MRPCVIFNPAAKGDKARRFRKHLDEFARRAEFKLTSGPGDARRLAAQAVREGFDPIVAAGGDGTLYEVLNGIAEVPGALDRVRLGVMPLGTVNVFARELRIPLSVKPAWDLVGQGHETRVDLPRISIRTEEGDSTVYFAQLAGAGLDAHAIELVDWEVKKRIGGLAYVLAGVRALRIGGGRVKVRANGSNLEGDLVLVGNGRLYGGDFRVFPNANLQDGLLDLCVFPRVSWFSLFYAALPLVFAGRIPKRLVQRQQVESAELHCDQRTPVEADGEWIGVLPAKLGVDRSRLRVVTPAPR